LIVKDFLFTPFDSPLSLKKKELKSTYRVIGRDFAKVNIGLIISILMAYIIKSLET